MGLRASAVYVPTPARFHTRAAVERVADLVFARVSVRPLGVLLVDDSEHDRRQIQHVLGEVPFAIQLAVLETAAETLDCLRAEGSFANVQPPDVVLLDLDVAEGGGHNLLADLKDDERTAGIPIVALSDNVRDAERATELGVHAFAVKPLSVEEFLRVVSFTQDVS